MNFILVVLMAIVFIGIGTNLGNRKANILKALMELNAVFSLKKVSSVYETEKWGKTKGNSFYNCVAKIETTLKPKEVLEKLLEIEQIFGRKRKTKASNANLKNKIYLARKIDLDLLFYGKKTLGENGLIIPHPELLNRKFVLVPLAEIAPKFRHPVSMQSMEELLENCADAKWVKKTGLRFSLPSSHGFNFIENSR